MVYKTSDNPAGHPNGYELDFSPVTESLSGWLSDVPDNRLQSWLDPAEAITQVFPGQSPTELTTNTMMKNANTTVTDHRADQQDSEPAGRILRPAGRIPLRR